MTKLQSILTGLVATLAVLVALLAAKQLPELSLGSTQPGFAVATSTTYLRSVGSTSAVTLFETSGCVNRVISTASTSIMISFGSTTPTADVGSWQAASSTITYDSGLYGCGNWRAFGFERSSSITSSTITVIDFWQ